jgi:hypothetical protein
LVEEDKGKVLREAKKNEFEFGLRPSFKKIGKYASEDYAAKKNTQNALAGYGNVDLIHTGAFVNSMFPVRSGHGFIFDASNDKKELLVEKYGKDILGLNQRTFYRIQREFYADYIAKFIQQRINNGRTNSRTRRTRV